MGENGSGKSTLLKGILGLIKPTRGRIELAGVKRTQLGYMPQQTVVQKDFPASVLEVVLSGCLNGRGMLPFYSKKERERARRSIDLLGIGKLARNSYRDLSGGQQQRVLLARALCATEKLLLLDEPAAGLDPVVTSDLYSLIDILNKERGITVIMVSHDVRSAVKYAGKIMHMDRKVRFFGPMADYRKTDAFLKMTGGGANG